MRLSDAVRRAAAERPGHPAVVSPGATLTYRELEAAANRLTAALAAAGVGRGDRVGWLGPNSALYAALSVAVERRGAALAAFNLRGTPDGVAEAERLIRPTLTVVDADPQLTAALRAPVLAAAGAGGTAGPGSAAGPVGAEGLAGTAGTVGTEGPAGTAGPTGPAGAGDGQVGAEGPAGLGGPWSALAPTPGAELEPRPGDPALLLFTSGSSGAPKAVELTHARVEAVMSETAPVGFGPDTVALVIPPVFHVAGASWVRQTLLAGGTMVFTADAAHLLRDITAAGVTHALLVPTLLAMLVEEQVGSGVPTPSLRYVNYGAAPISPRLLDDALRSLGCRFQQMYGMTEAGGIVTSLLPDDHHGPHLRSAGRPLPGVEVAVFDAEGRQLGAGESGELHVRSPYVMQGYWQDPPSTARTLPASGWLRSHDAAHIHPDGYVYIEGRLDDVIITGGENVHPGEVEAVLSAAPGVAAVSVVGVADERWGQRVVAAVVPDAGGLDESAVATFARSRLPGYKCPRELVRLDALPTTATGKVSRALVEAVVTARHDAEPG